MGADDRAGAEEYVEGVGEEEHVEERRVEGAGRGEVRGGEEGKVMFKVRLNHGRRSWISLTTTAEQRKIEMAQCIL